MDRNKRRLQVRFSRWLPSLREISFLQEGAVTESLPCSANTMVALRDARAIAIIDGGFSPIN